MHDLEMTVGRAQCPVYEGLYGLKCMTYENFYSVALISKITKINARTMHF
eukprot:COSAG05_NODE_502_length_9214_cov_3.816676_3_plen_50_part_00